MQSIQIKKWLESIVGVTSILQEKEKVEALLPRGRVTKTYGFVIDRKVCRWVSDILHLLPSKTKVIISKGSDQSIEVSKFLSYNKGFALFRLYSREKDTVGPKTSELIEGSRWKLPTSNKGGAFLKQKINSWLVERKGSEK